MRKKAHSKSEKESLAMSLVKIISESRNSGNGRGISISKTGYTERTIYKYAKEYPPLKEEMSKFHKDRRLYK